MCGRFNFSSSLESFVERYDLDKVSFPFTPHYNIAPGMTVPVVLRRSPLHSEPMRWGLVPSWAKEPKGMINARAETAAERPTFCKAFQSQRCLIPANSFFEWQQVEGGKVPYSISVTDEAIFSMAGLWDVWRDGEGQELHTFTILTTAPNELLSPIHDRMPVILTRDQEPFWLDPDEDPRALEELLLTPYPAHLMQATRISPLVNSPANDGPEILRPIS